MPNTKLILLCALLLSLIGCSQADRQESAGRNATDNGAAGTSASSEVDGSSGSFSSAGTGAGEGGAAGTSASAPEPGGLAGTSGAAGLGAPAAGVGGAGGTGSFGDSDGFAGPPPSGEAGSGSQPPVQSGTLTAGVWDDNRNFTRFSAYRSELLQQSGVRGVLPTSDAQHAAARDRFTQAAGARARLDLALVVDTTGSMSDEITYLQAELTAISQTIEERYPNAEQRWALVFYRDQGDDYVVRSFDFASDLSQVRTNLNAQSAGGGGDYPEAPDAALAETNALAWRTGDDVARLAFWVADAPHHAENAEALADAILEAQGLGIHLYPVASSGVDELTELSMRSGAQLTGGRYLFLTDDSGVGGEHKEPSIPCYFVTRLDHAMLRMVDIELTGNYREPTAAELIRTGGDPEDGACTLEGGEVLEVF